MNNTSRSDRNLSAGSRARASRTRFVFKSMAFSMMLAFGANSHALPTGGVVSAGAASIAGGSGTTTITQTTQNVAINWQSFSIGQTEAVNFVQPNSSSVALNRVLGADPSNIMGSLSANGKVFLINPNGILFGNGAQVNVGGLVASTLGLSDADFMAGKYNFSGGGSGSVLNQGSINADGGYIALLGANVSNEGVISARLGNVVLAAGSAMTLDVAGDGLLNLTIDQGAVNTLVKNGGLIQADGGRVLLTAKAAGDLLSVVNNTGVIRAQTIQNINGDIRLMGDMQSGTVIVGGTLDASAPNGGNGGFIETSAAHVQIASDVQITTAAPAGVTGTWLIDPVDFNIAAAGGDITGLALTNLLVNNNVTISTVMVAPNTATTFFAAPGQGDINVNDFIGVGSGALWTPPGLLVTTLTLTAARSVNINQTITATRGNLTINAGLDVNINKAVSLTNGNLVVCCGQDINVREAITTVNGSVLLSAGRDVSLLRSALFPNSAITTTDGNIELCAGRDVTISNTLNAAAIMTLTRGSNVAAESLASLGVPFGLTIISGNAGNGPGVASGTVNITATNPGGDKIAITGAGVGNETPATIYYNPTSYATPTDYAPKYTLVNATQTSRMLVYPEVVTKTVDGTTTATLVGFKGNPTGVTLVAGGAAAANFDNTTAGTNKTVSFTGYTLGGASAALYALPLTCCSPIVGKTRGTIAVNTTSANPLLDYVRPPIFLPPLLASLESLDITVLPQNLLPIRLVETYPPAVAEAIEVPQAVFVPQEEEERPVYVPPQRVRKPDRN